MHRTAPRSPAPAPLPRRPGPPAPVTAPAAAVPGFFGTAFDAGVGNVALPSIRRDVGGGITGL
ncbi:hypothetical protein [Streptomyces sp. A1136]|uniref:hypothetical protein n=1 Tax=Streptomyces sp. A1136 TaxID=2563102 RepID=UPI00109E735B|nr:hypothetical protein [Streptomyces sp. A1136]THA58036.1 hypothetical protein E6R62_06095 [Streptomyces sp. A1136]